MNKLIERILYWMFPSIQRTQWKHRLEGMMEPGSFYLNGFMGAKTRVLVTDRLANGRQEMHIESRVGDRWMRVGKVAESDVFELMQLIIQAFNFLHPGTFEFKAVPK